RLTLLAASTSRMSRFLASLASPIRKYTRKNTAVGATVVTITNARARRTADDRKNSSTGVQHETGSANIDNQRRRPLGVDFLAQIADMHVDHIGLEREVILPDVLEQHRARNDPPGMAEKIFQEPELARQQADPDVAAIDSLFDEVHFQVANPQLGGSHVVEPAQHRL